MSNGSIRLIPSITYDLAHRIVDAGVTVARDNGHPAVIAVVDAGSQLVALARMDGAAPQSIQLACDKAYTAVGLKLPTQQWNSIALGDAAFAVGVSRIDRFIPYGGGVPLVDDGQIIGGVGVSGARSADDEAALAERAASVLFEQ
ncbi:GlcG/HbpS family heme-binding protein [Pseudonocardia oroxyli]|uniref:GlcG/HbpS family heme-binding protein n=1 Tax=Pseudonocardia oroxyli TaxID=366584 RepID=UPI000B8411F8|nr:heme-binding protein [Pseudonocardia oroxyli]